MLGTLNCSSFASIVQALPLVEQCDELRNGGLRMSTPFSYPNGEKVDVFIDSDRSLLPDDFMISDHGLTAIYLKNSLISMGATTRKKELLKDILRGSKVGFKGSRLFVRPESLEARAISDAIFRLSQMCVRVSDMATHQRLRSTNAFRDDVEDFFEAQGLRWTPDVKLPPVFGDREIRMDFEVKHGNKASYVNVIAALNDAAAHHAANEIVVKIGDLKRSPETVLHNFVTIFNSDSSAIRQDDIERLATLSSTVAFPQAIDTLSRVLRDEDDLATLELETV